METNQESVTPEYLKAFNNGYAFKKEFPDLADTIIAAIDSNSEPAAGFKDGCRQYDIEQDKNLTPDWMKERPEGYDERDKEPEQDKDDYDLER